MNRVCFISVYFGKIPPFFRTFLDSCRWNPQFDWLIVHDENLNYECPENVHELLISLEKFRDEVTKKVNIEIPKIKPYKVCDYRPAFGIIFKEYIKNYEFWGICDTDLILGNLKEFITDEMLDTYDKIFTMGHMSLVRNTDNCNWLFKRDTANSKNYKYVFQDERNHIYDEFNGFTEKFCDIGYNVYKFKKCADITSKCGRLRVNERWFIRCIQPQNSFISFSVDENYKYQVFWEYDGHTYRTYINKENIVKEEYSYIHKIDYAYENHLSKKDFVILTTNGYVLVEDKKIIKDFIENKVSKKLIREYNASNEIEELFSDFYWFVRWKLRYFKANLKNRLNKEK